MDELYLIKTIPCEVVCYFLHYSDDLFDADFRIVCMCVLHLPSLLNVRPRCLWLSIHVTGTLPNINLGIIIFFCVVNKIASVFGDKNQQANAWPIR
jgi:hypothetical protein